MDQEGNTGEIPCDKLYFLNFLFQYKYADDSEEFRRFRIAINRDGIKDIAEIK